MTGMAPLKAVVKNGRIIVDEPTELPDGTELELVPRDAEMTPEQRAELDAAIEESAAGFDRGEYVDGFELIAQLRAKREAASR